MIDMNWMTRTSRPLIFGLGLCALALACSDDGPVGTTETGETATGDGDPTTGDGDPTTGDGDPTTGDGDPTTGDGDPTTGDGDPTTGDGDPTGDGDGDPGADPVASIFHPGNDEVRQVNVPIPFIGEATDAEDGVLMGMSIVWTSDLEGQIGTGTMFDAPLTMVGMHTITMTATDSDNQQGSDAIQLQIQ